MRQLRWHEIRRRRNPSSRKLRFHYGARSEGEAEGVCGGISPRPSAIRQLADQNSAFGFLREKSSSFAKLWRTSRISFARLEPGSQNQRKKAGASPCFWFVIFIGGVCCRMMGLFARISEWLIGGLNKAVGAKVRITDLLREYLRSRSNPSLKLAMKIAQVFKTKADECFLEAVVCYNELSGRFAANHVFGKIFCDIKMRV